MIKQHVGRHLGFQFFGRHLGIQFFGRHLGIQFYGRHLGLNSLLVAILEFSFLVIILDNWSQSCIPFLDAILDSIFMGAILDSSFMGAILD